MEDFGDILKIRAANHHSKCSICVRHRLIIKKLPQGPGKLAQIQQYKNHLDRQYRDRQVYWNHRSVSRHQKTTGQPVTEVCLILDGMDQCKHSYPKSACMASKELNNWARPKLAATTIIAHGHGVLVGLSPDNVPCSGSRTMELLGYMLTKQLSYIHWPQCFVNLSADNCVKEIKHQTALRVFATMVGTHRLKGCSLNFLSSGHSHEDIDAYFAVVSSWLDRFPELHTVSDFQNCLTNMLANKSMRVNEPLREVVVYDQFHDWPLVSNQMDKE